MTDRKILGYNVPEGFYQDYQTVTFNREERIKDLEKRLAESEAENVSLQKIKPKGANYNITSPYEVVPDENPVTCSWCGRKNEAKND